MLEDLMLSDNVKAMRDLIISIKRFLRKGQDKGVFEVYKFIGDGWILLFPPEVQGKQLIGFMEALCRVFKRKLKKHVLPQLQTKPSVVGLSFGVDRGSLVRVIMMENPEYIGRPLNIASRLQAAIRQRDNNPAYKVLFSKPSFSTLGISSGFRSFGDAKRSLRNIQGGENYACVKLMLRV